MTTRLVCKLVLIVFIPALFGGCDLYRDDVKQPPPSQSVDAASWQDFDAQLPYDWNDAMPPDYDVDGPLPYDVDGSPPSLDAGTNCDTDAPPALACAPDGSAFAVEAHYIIDGEANPGLILCRGFSYEFRVGVLPEHPFWIVVGHPPDVQSGTPYNEGVKYNGTTSGTIPFQVPQDAPKSLSYMCENHPSEHGAITVIDGP